MMLRIKQAECNFLFITTWVLPERVYNFHYGNVYILVLSSWKVNIAENPIAIMGLYRVSHKDMI